MKKLFGLFLLTFLSANIVALASTNIEIQPTMQTRTNSPDRVWVGTFQLVWNDFIDKIVHNPVRFREGTPNFVQELNKKEFTVNDISENAYYKYIGKITKNTKKIIAQGIRKKFKENSDILDKLNLSPRNDKFIIYAMLKKDFEFPHEYNKLGESQFGDTQKSEYFGIQKQSKPELRKDVNVLFYNSQEDFAIKLKTKTLDEVYIYKNASNKPFNYLYEDMNKKTQAYQGNSDFLEEDELKIPLIKFFTEKSFDELTGKRIMGTNLVIGQAIESVKFNMNSKGVKLKSEAAMTIMKMSLDLKVPARYFYCDNTFVIFLKESGKRTPYFALRVNDISKFQK